MSEKLFDELVERKIITSLKADFQRLVAEKSRKYAFDQLRIMVTEFIKDDGIYQELKEKGFTYNQIADIALESVLEICKKMNDLES